MKFIEMNIKESLKTSLQKQGFTSPTEVQEKAVPVALTGKDAIVRSKTGSGKTIAFLLPILCRITNEKRPQALVLTPTRELAQQIFKDMRKLDSVTNSTLLYGGVSLQPQTESLQQGTQVIIGTPGRILDHLARGSLNLSTIRFLVLDEADRMLDMGFIDDVNKIITQMPKERQTMLFSATMPDEIVKLSNKYMNSPEKIMLSEDEIVVNKINQKCYGVSREEKLSTLVKILKDQTVTKTIIFCNTKRWAESLGRILWRKGIKTLVIHSGLSQNQRTRTIDSFKQGVSRILIATDVVSRGLHIEQISHVINYDLPRNPKDYIHRIGRTGRAGKNGEAISLITQLDEPLLRNIEREIQQYLTIQQSEKFTSTPARQAAVAGDNIASAWDKFD